MDSDQLAHCYGQDENLTSLLLDLATVIVLSNAIIERKTTNVMKRQPPHFPTYLSSESYRIRSFLVLNTFMRMYEIPISP